MTTADEESVAGLPGASEARELIKISMSYTRARALQTAVELGLFARLATGPLDLAGVCREMGLEQRVANAWIDALVGLGVLHRGRDGSLANSVSAAHFLVPGGRRYIGGTIVQHGRVHYGLWGSLTDTLRHGRAQSGPRTPVRAMDDAQTDIELARRFYDHMDAFNGFVADELAKAIDWNQLTSFADIGGARGNVAVQIARAHPHLRGVVMDVPGVAPLFDEVAERCGAADSVRFEGGDFFSSPLPSVEAMILGHVLHDWPLESRRSLISRVYDALPHGGLMLVYDAMLDETAPPEAHLQSLVCSVMREGGSEYPVDAVREWAAAAGFVVDRVVELNTVTADRLVVARKP